MKKNIMKVQKKYFIQILLKIMVKIIYLHFFELYLEKSFFIFF
jgi:hypothetical protein